MVILFVKNLNPRINYTFQLVFGEVMGITYEITNDPDQFNQSNKLKINYSASSFTNCLDIHPEGLLDETELINLVIPTGEWNKLPTLFANDSKNVPFDIFSAIFYLVSRYEEYLPFEADEHNRFEADQSTACKKNFLQVPIVDLWCQHLARTLGILRNCRNLLPSHYSFTLSIDVDNAWRYKNLGPARLIPKILKDLLSLNFTELLFMLRVVNHRRTDPGDSYNFLDAQQKKLKNKIEYFILCRHSGKFDGSVPLQNRFMKKLVRSLSSEHPVGLHPSYASNKSFRLLRSEHKELEELVNHPIEKSRQHYLILNLPDTYRNLIKLGIKEDYTMGYASKTGFRAGIARPFYFYDLYEEKQTELKVFPFQVMDRTLQQYMRSTPANAKEEMKIYTESIKSVGGNFCALWHNTSLNENSEWKGWLEVFKAMIDYNHKK